MNRFRSYKSVVIAGLALLTASAAVAQDAGVWFRGTDGDSVRTIRENTPRLDFSPATNLLLGGETVSAPAAFAGPSGPFRLQASSGQIRLCDDALCTTPGAWSNTAQVRAGQFVQVSRPGPRAPSEVVAVEVSGTGLSTSFQATARATPPRFGSIPSLTVSPNELAESDLATFRGWIETDLTVASGSARVCPPQGNCGAWSTNGAVRDGDQIQLRGDAGSFGATRTVTASAGGATASFDIVTRAKNTVPAGFAFGTGPLGVEPGSTSVSNSITLSGFDDAPITVTGGSYSLNGSPFTTTAGTATAGDALRVQLLAGVFSETRTATIEVGGVSATWSSTVRARRNVPDTIANFTALENQTPGTTVTSSIAQLTGHDGINIAPSGPNALIQTCSTATCTGGIQSGFSSSVTVGAGQYIQLRTVVGAAGATQTISLAYGGASPATWTVSAAAAAVGTGQGQISRVNGSWMDVSFARCGSGTGACTEQVAKDACKAIGLRLVSHASDNTSEVVSLGATASCNFGTSYIRTTTQMPTNSCLAGVANSDWSSCCGRRQWHGATVPLEAPGRIFGSMPGSIVSGYNPGYPVSSTIVTWGCQARTNSATAPSSCTSVYVACGA